MTAFTYDYPRPMVTVDCIVFCRFENKKQILLILRKNEPFIGTWALPGGFVDMDENLDAAAQRELYEETGLRCQTLKQFRTYGTPDRDPRGRTISVVFYAEVSNADKQKIVAGDDASDAGWFNIQQLPKLAFDHQQIIQDYFFTVESEQFL